MDNSELPPNSKNNKTITNEELISIIRTRPKEFISNAKEKPYILIKGYNIESTFLLFGHRQALDIRIQFLNCYFKSDFLMIDEITSNESLIFEDCEMQGSIVFSGVILKKEVILKYVNVKTISFPNSELDKVSIYGCNVEDVRISSSKFNSIQIEGYISGSKISKLRIFTNENDSGNVDIKNLEADYIYLSGINKGNNFIFNKIQCDVITLENFKNQGSLKFYEIEPRDLENKNSFFQIINSNLDSAEFYKVIFSQYKELVIINSYITSSLFIGCTWKNNIRAIPGYGFGNYEESLKTGRKISPKETIEIKEAYRQLKVSMSKHSDKIQEHKFYSQELNFYNKTLNWGMPWENKFWDKLILYFSNICSDYGQSFIKPLSLLLLGHLILFCIAIQVCAFETISFNIDTISEFNHDKAFEKYFIYLNPIRGIETSFSGYLILLDYLMRIWSSYMIYNLIRASRRFIS